MEPNALVQESLPQPTLRDYIDVLLRRWWVIAAVAGGGLLVALVISAVSPRIYKASARVVVDRSGQTLLVADFTGLTQQTFVDTLTEIIKSRAVADLALKHLPPTTNLNRVRAEIHRGLVVQRVRGTDLIVISTEGSTAEEAAQRANAVARGLVEWHLEARRSQASAGARFIESQQAKVGQELRAAEDALAAYKASAGRQVALSEQTSYVVAAVAEIEAQRRTAAAERQATEAGLRQARSTLAKVAPQVTGMTFSEDPLVTDLRQRLVQLEIELAGLRQQFTDRHPKVIGVLAQIEEAKSRLRAHAARTASEIIAANPVYDTLASQVISLEVEREALTARESAFAQILDRYVREAKALPQKEVQLARLTRDVTVAEQTYLLLAQKLQEANIAEASIVGDVRIVDSALPSNRPVRPRPQFDAMLGLMLGLLLGVGASYGLEMLDTTFKSPEDVERQLGLPVLAVIPQLRKTDRQERLPLIMEHQRRSPFAEAFRHLRTNLLYMSPDRPLRTIEVTSPGPGEGKSTAASNLAAAFAQIGKHVWLVECDLRKPNLALTFQPKTDLGLTDLLVDGLPVDEAVHATSVENLWIIPSGTKPPNPAELLGSHKMKALLAGGTNGADTIILDAPPILPVTDATVLAPSADGVLLVVNMLKTPRDAARRARQQLEAVGARVLGVIINGMPERSRGYSYYYSYEYSGYYSDETEDKARPSAKPAGSKK